MKCKVTRKEVKNNYPKIVGISYCQAQNLLSFYEPFAYNLGTFGWNCNYYDINGACVCTGYKPHGNVDFDNKELNELENKARNIDYRLSYENRRKIIIEMFESWVEKVTEG